MIKSRKLYCEIRYSVIDKIKTKTYVILKTYLIITTNIFNKGIARN